MNSKNSKTTDPHRLSRNPTDKMNLKGSDKNVTLSNFIIYYKSKNTKNPYNICANQNYKFELSDVSYFLSDSQDYFKRIIKKCETMSDKPSRTIYVNTLENSMIFKIKTG